MSKSKSKTMFKIDDAFAAACAAQRINGEYNKETQSVIDPVTYETKVTKLPNKVLMRQMIIDQSSITDDDRSQAQTIRSYFQCKLMEVLSNTASDFTRTAVAVSSKEEIASDSWYDLAIVASLPQSYERSLERDKRNEIKMDAAAISQHFGTVGERIVGECEIIDCRYSANWNTYYVSAKFKNNLILFAYKSMLDADKKYQFSGTIKAHRENSVTQLNRVKLKDTP